MTSGAFRWRRWWSLSNGEQQSSRSSCASSIIAVILHLFGLSTLEDSVSMIEATHLLENTTSNLASEM